MFKIEYTDKCTNRGGIVIAKSKQSAIDAINTVRGYKKDIHVSISAAEFTKLIANDVESFGMVAHMAKVAEQENSYELIAYLQREYSDCLTREWVIELLGNELVEILDLITNED